LFVVFFGSADAEHDGEEPAGKDENHAADRHEGTGREPEEADDSEDERDNDGDVATHRPILWVGTLRQVPRVVATALLVLVSLVVCAGSAAARPSHAITLAAVGDTMLGIGGGEEDEK
jgi:hypothetical protein